jgi:non-specific serine/threonine protein kinase
MEVHNVPRRKLKARRPAAVREPNNLPTPLTSFVGRQSDVGALRKLIREARLVTLVGPGGIGKSRLAIEVARHTPDRFPDGVWWIDLTPIDDPQQVDGAVATALHLGGFASAHDALTSWLANKRTMLVLDNCEHVVLACATLCRTLLRDCPDLSLLATSREPVGIEGEARWPVAPLTELDAVSLFEQRGRLVLPAFKVTPANREEVTQICRRLDALPLAIELAASKLGAMSEREISRQLAQSFRLLSARLSDDSRHRTMTAAIDWSYRLLTETEAALFRRLSVFQGGFTLEVATVICADELVADVTGTLGSLVEKSLVALDRLDDGTARYRMLEAQRAYAQEKLAVAGETDWTEKRRYDSFYAACKAFHDEPDRPRGSLEERRWQGEIVNTWAALTWARAHEADLGLGLASVAEFAFYGDLARGRAWLTDLLASSPGQGRARMLATTIAASLAYRQGDNTARLSLAQASEEMARGLGDDAARAHALHRVGGALLDLGRLDEAETTLNQALGLMERLMESPGDIRHERLLRTIKNDLGVLALYQGRFESARATLTNLVELRRASRVAESVYAVSGTLLMLAEAEFGCGQPEPAEKLWKESLAMARETEELLVVFGSIVGLARSATARGEHVRSIRLAAVEDRWSKEFATRGPAWFLDRLRASQETSRAKLGPERSGRAWAEGMAMSLDRAIDYAMEVKTPADHPLSRREFEVAVLVSEGLSNRAIAERLHLSDRTAESHVKNICDKLGFNSRSQVAAWVAARKPAS